MKRRNTDAGKPPRRPTKRTNKFADSVYGSSFIYIKFIAVWLLILLADFILEFRFEYVWPFWLLLQSVYETFKYQGLGYSLLFVCIAITSDTICLLFIPIQYLFFLASTYVWIHYVWHTDRGLCLPTIAMWVLIMYVEVTVRIRDIKGSQLQIDVCRPFAAHCIGHPVVTLGIGFKSYIYYRLKLRTQRHVRKENSFYYELLRQALPRELHHNHTLAVTDKDKNDSILPANGLLITSNHKKCHDRSQKPVPAQDSTLQIAEVSTCVATPTKSASSASSTPSTQRKQSNKDCSNANVTSIKNNNDTPVANNSVVMSTPDSELRKRNITASQPKKSSSTDSIPLSQSSKSSSKTGVSDNSPKSSKQNLKSSASTSDFEKLKPAAIPSSPVTIKELPVLTALPLSNGHLISEKNNDSKIELISTPSLIEQLESTIAKLRNELNLVRKNESELRSDHEVLMNTERLAKSELIQLRKDNESLQTKLSSLLSCKLKDKHNIQSMEKRLKTEVDNRESAEKHLIEEKRRRKEEEETSSRAAAIAQCNRDKETAEALKKAKKDLQDEIESLQKKLNEKEEECNKLKINVAELQVRERSTRQSETLMSALEVMQEKTLMLETSLSAETRLKLDLFSALGDVKRQLEISRSVVYKRESEIAEMKARMSDLLSVMPEQRLRSPTPHYSANFLENSIAMIPSPSQEFTNTYCPMPRAPAPPVPAMIQGHPPIDPGMINHVPTVVNLDPNAAIYTPSSSGV